MTATLLELGDATSRNLEFSHRDDVSVSYGEETITETNLLELRRRHPKCVHVHTFPKHIEAKKGADWEWYIVGDKLTAKMRVQAKRLQNNDVLKIKHKVASSGKQQRALLIDEAHKDKMKPIYCIYCTEPQRTLWTEKTTTSLGYESYHMGCLLADASDVPLSTRRLGEIEQECKPWHYLFERSLFGYEKRESIVDHDDIVQFVTAMHTLGPTPLGGVEMELEGRLGWNAPTVNDLNEDPGRQFDRTGVAETTAEDHERLRAETDEGQWVARYDRERLHERGICRMIVMDVRSERDFEE